MSIQNSPYAAFATLLAGSPQSVSPAELHGLLLGRSCAGAGFDVEPWLLDASDLLGEAPQDNVRQALIGLQEMVKGELAGDDIEKGPARVGSFVLASLGMTFLGAISAVPEGGD